MAASQSDPDVDGESAPSERTRGSSVEGDGRDEGERIKISLTHS